jgi:hypothetical protein
MARGSGATNRPPWVRTSGLPVRVMCTSEMARRCSALLAILGAVDRTAVGREAMVAGGGCGMWDVPRRAASQSIEVELRSIQCDQAIETLPAGSELPAHPASPSQEPLERGQSERRDSTRQAACTGPQQRYGKVGTYHDQQAALPRQVGELGRLVGSCFHHQLPVINQLSNFRLSKSRPQIP